VSTQLLYNEYRGIYSRGYSDRSVKLASHLHLVPRLRIRGGITPLHHTSS